MNIKDKILDKERELSSSKRRCASALHALKILEGQLEQAVQDNDPEEKQVLLRKIRFEDNHLKGMEGEMEDRYRELHRLRGSLASMAPMLAKEAHNWDPVTISGYSNKSLEWKCPKGHVYMAFVHNRVSKKTGCPFCSNHRVLAGFNDFATTNPKLAKEAYGWDPATIIAGTHKKLTWACEAGHTYEKSPFLRAKNKRSLCLECKGAKETVSYLSEGYPSKYKSLLIDEGLPLEVDSIGVGYEKIKNVSRAKSLKELKRSILEEGQAQNILVFINEHNITENELLGRPYQLIDGELRMQALAELNEEHPGDKRFEYINADILDPISYPSGIIPGEHDGRLSDSPKPTQRRLRGDLGRVAEALESEAPTRLFSKEESWESVCIMPDLEIRARGEYGKDLEGLKRLAAAIRSRIEEA